MNAVALSEKARQDLGKILGLLESEHVGERDAAVRAATRLLERHGLRWCEILSAVSVTVIRQQEQPRHNPPRHGPSDPFPGRSWYDIAARCGEYPQYLDAWELEFIEGCRDFRSYLLTICQTQHDRCPVADKGM